MISYEITADKEQLKEAISLFEFVGGNSRDAMRVAINKTARLTRTSTKGLPGGGASQRIRKQVRLKASYVNERLVLTPATKNKLTASIKAPSRGLLLSRYSTDSKISGGNFAGALPPPVPKRGIRVKVKPGGSPKALSREFFYMVLPGSKALAIVRRRDKPGPKGGKIDVAYAPSLSQVFTSVKDDLTPVASAQLQVELLDAMRSILAKKFPKE